MNPLAQYQGSRFASALFVVHCARWVARDAARAAARDLAALGLYAGVAVVGLLLRFPVRRRR